MTMTITWDADRDLPWAEQYERAGAIIDQAKSAAAERRSEIAAAALGMLGATEAAAILGVSRQRLYQLAARHRTQPVDASEADAATRLASWSGLPGLGHTDTPDEYVTAYVATGDTDWLERCRTSGALDAMCNDFRAAIAKLLPAGVTLAGRDFYGPYATRDADRADLGRLAAEIDELIDLGAIVAKHDPDTAE